MTKAVAVHDEYEDLLKKFTELGQHMAGLNLRTYFFVGRLYTEFFEAAGTPKYGGRKVGVLAEDLKAKGVLGEIQDIPRFLYWAKNTFDFFETEANLVSHIEKGFTISHGKLLFGQKDDLIEAVSAKMVGESGKMVSVLALETMLAREGRNRSIEITKAGGEIEVFTDTTTQGPGKAEIEAPKTVAPTKEEKPLGAKEEKVKPVKDSTTPSTPTVASPLKVLNSLEKTISKAIIDLPDALIALKETSKRGFDTEKAEKNFKTAVSNLKAALKDSIEPFQVLLKEINECE